MTLGTSIIIAWNRVHSVRVRYSDPDIWCPGYVCKTHWPIDPALLSWKHDKTDLPACTCIRQSGWNTDGSPTLTVIQEPRKVGPNLHYSSIARPHSRFGSRLIQLRTNNLGRSPPICASLSGSTLHTGLFRGEKKVILIMNWKGYRSRWGNTELNILLLCQAVFLVSGNGAFTDGIVFCSSYLLLYDVISKCRGGSGHRNCFPVDLSRINTPSCLNSFHFSYHPTTISRLRSLQQYLNFPFQTPYNSILLSQSNS